MSRATKVKLPYGFRQKIKCDLSSTDTVLQLRDSCAESALCMLLGRDCYTHLILSDCVMHEIVRVECINGQLVMTRAQECTERMKLQACDPVFFEMTPELARDSLREDTSDGSVQGFKSDTLDITTDPEDPTQICIELKKKEPVEFCTPGYTYVFEEGCLTQTADPSTAIKDGVVRNPTLCFKDNKIVRVEPGDTFDYSMTCHSCGGCGCSDCTAGAA